MTGKAAEQSSREKIRVVCLRPQARHRIAETTTTIIVPVKIVQHVPSSTLRHRQTPLVAELFVCIQQCTRNKSRADYVWRVARDDYLAALPRKAVSPTRVL